MAGIYIHIPFCTKACYYCDFHFSTNLHRKVDMLDAIAMELENRKNYLGEHTIETIYFGGGTPSLLKEKDIYNILDTIKHNYILNEKLEITLEANPNDLTYEKLIELKNTPINRLSIGIQSLHDDILRWMNRSHDSKQAQDCIRDVHKTGFDNISVDFIYGVPSLSNSQWIQDLQWAIDHHIDHLSCYNLTVEHNTVLAHKIASGEWEEPDEKLAIAHFHAMTDLLSKQNYEHYEISNFAKNKKYSKHNTAYWQGKKYLGVGPSAHSFDGNSRQWNIANNAQYIKSIQENRNHFTIEEISPTTQLNEIIMTRLRTMWGMPTHILYKAEPSLEYIVNDYIDKGLIRMVNNNICLSGEGMLLADTIISDLMIV